MIVVRCAWILVVTAACGFEHGALPRDASSDDAERDAKTDAKTDAAGDVAADTRVALACDPLDSTLLACYPCEGSAQDVSGHGLHATMTNASFVAGKVGMAMQSSATSASDVADSTLFDVATITIEAWIYPTEIPAAGLRAGIVDVDGQYGVFLHEQGRLQCTMVNGISMQIDAAIAANAWTHVACTYDGTATTIYINGLQQFQGTGGGMLATGGASGMSIAGNNPAGSGSRLIGLVDEVRMYNVARTAAEVCLDAQCN